VTPHAPTIIAKLSHSGTATLDEIAGWFDCPSMQTVKVLGKMVDQNIIHRVGWAENGVSVWGLKNSAEMADAA